MSKMICPECGALVGVRDSRLLAGNIIRRRRYCDNGHRFTTIEVAMDGENLEFKRSLLVQRTLDKYMAERLIKLAAELTRETKAGQQLE